MYLPFLVMYWGTASCIKHLDGLVSPQAAGKELRRLLGDGSFIQSQPAHGVISIFFRKAQAVRILDTGAVAFTGSSSKLSRSKLSIDTMALEAGAHVDGTTMVSWRQR